MNNKKVAILPNNYNSYSLPANEKIKFLMISAPLLMLVAYIFYKSLLIAILFLLILPVLIKLYEAKLAQKQKRELNNQFRDVLYSISASVSAGRHLPEALCEAKENMRLIYGDNGLIVLELIQIVKGLYESKESEEQVLTTFSKRTGLEDIANFIEIYFTCRSTGGDLERIIIKAADSIMEKISIQREIQMLTAQKKFEGKLLTALPFIVIGFLEVTSPDYLSVMYETVQGRIMMTAALLGIGFAYFMTSKITDIEV